MSIETYNLQIVNVVAIEYKVHDSMSRVLASGFLTMVDFEHRHSYQRLECNELE